MQDNEPINLTYGQMSDMVNRIEQIPSLSGEGAPTSDTPAFHLGQTYIDTITGDMYYCSDIFDESGGLPQYTWNLATEDVPEYVAGDNVTIEDESGALVISATDTTYSDFTGTDGTAAGTAGLVPAPATTDAGKFLKADGTWDTAGGGGSSVIELTSADYDYPTDNPNSIALWLLETGWYTSDGTNPYVRFNVSANVYRIEKGDLVYVKKGIGSGSASRIFMFGKGNTVTVYSTGSASGSEYSSTTQTVAISQTTGTSQTEVMSQNATTSLVFADPSTKYRVQIGTGSSTTTNHGIAIGTDAMARAAGAIALGRGANAYTQGQMDIGTFVTSQGYNSSNYRLLTGLYDPQSAHDAATKGYVDPTTDSSAPTTATVGRLGQIQIDTANNDAYMCVAVDDVTPAYIWKKITA